MKIVPVLMRVPLDSLLGLTAIELMNKNHEKHICQDSLDLYRDSHSVLIDTTTDEIFCFVAIYAGNIVGMTAAVVKDNEMHNSITVVAAALRKFGIGSALMKYKTDCIKSKYPTAKLTTKVSKANDASLKACLKAGLAKISEGIDKKKDKEVAYAILGTQ